MSMNIDQAIAAQVQRENDLMMSNLRQPNTHYSPQGCAQFPTKMIVEASDPRLAQLAALFGKMDERGKLTLLRMAASIPGAGVKG